MVCQSFEHYNVSFFPHIFNSSLFLGHVSRIFKLAVIKHLIKKPQLDPNNLANYRPISSLPGK